jgi:hypothetical protein
MSEDTKTPPAESQEKPNPLQITVDDLNVVIQMFRRVFKGGLVEADEAYPVSTVLEKIKNKVREVQKNTTK